MKKDIPYKTIYITVGICATIFTFIFTYTMKLKDARIELLEEQVEKSEKIDAIPQVIEGLETKIIEIQKMIFPLATVTPIDLITGEIVFGQSFFIETNLTMDLLKALNLIHKKKYDLALSMAVEMDKYCEFYLGNYYIRFLVNQAKGYKDEAAKFADLILKKIPTEYKPSDHHQFNLKKVYEFKIDYSLSQSDKKQAEEANLKALELWPNEKKFIQLFEKNFGYKPTMLNNKQ